MTNVRQKAVVFFCAILLLNAFLFCRTCQSAEYDFAGRLDSAFGLGGYFHYIHNPTYDFEWHAVLNVYPHFDISGGFYYPSPFFESFFSISKTFFLLRLHPLLSSDVIGGRSSSIGLEPGASKDFGWMSLECGLILAKDSGGKLVMLPNLSASIYIFDRFQKPEL